MWLALLGLIDRAIEALPLPRKKRKSKSAKERQNWD